MFFMIACLAGLGGLQADVIANFDGGTDAVPDGYLGTSGDGWNSPWLENNASTAPPTQNTVLSSGGPIPDGGNYLSAVIIPSPTSTTGSRYALTRDFSTGVDQTQPYRVELTYRIDEDVDSENSTFNDYHDRYVIAEGEGGDNDTGTHNSWSIYTYGADGDYTNPGAVKMWAFYSGLSDGSAFDPDPTRLISTGIALTTGGTYHFTIDVFPNADPSLCTWNATVDDGTASFTQNNMGFRTGSGAKTFLYFLTKKNKTVPADEYDDIRKFSVDGISISTIPEPSTFLLLAMGCGLLLIFRHRRRY
ncbi:MAG: PEP-CTERM sorting domain-containing protein [Pirellulales bacterium]|nr:PEP-CTERM sorting domain-containing protein [Pirellulales bacterium]